MSNYVSITRLLDAGSGVGASHIGIPFGVYRLSNTSNGDWIQSSNKIFSMWVDRDPMKRSDPAFESSLRQNIFWFSLMCNADPLLTGDILVSEDPYYNKGKVLVDFDTNQFIGLCFAAENPVKHPLAARIDTTAQFYRPSNAPSTQTTQNIPTFDMTLPQELPIVCTAGQFAPGALTDVASAIPIGTMPENNTGAIFSVATANMPSQERRRMYIPPLPGFFPKAGDKIITAGGSRYVMLGNYRQDAGTVGYQILVEKETSGGA